MLLKPFEVAQTDSIHPRLLVQDEGSSVRVTCEGDWWETNEDSLEWVSVSLNKNAVDGLIDWLIDWFRLHGGRDK